MTILLQSPLFDSRSKILRGEVSAAVHSPASTVYILSWSYNELQLEVQPSYLPFFEILSLCLLRVIFEILTKHNLNRGNLIGPGIV